MIVLVIKMCEGSDSGLIGKAGTVLWVIDECIVVQPETTTADCARPAVQIV